ncbi:MAG: 3-oxoacid CoA-transferase subunit B [Agathobacter sp.]
MDKKQYIAKRAATYLKDGDVVNLGIGIPSFCADYASDNIWFQCENGLLGAGEIATGLRKVESFCNAGAIEIVPKVGACAFSHALSFGMIRGGRVDVTILGGLQVSEKGDLANWASPGRAFGMGGAMDLVNGAKKVVVAMELCTKDGKPKILKECNFPLTGKTCVDHIVTEYCEIDVTDEGLVLTGIVDGYNVENIQAMIEPLLLIKGDVRIMPHEWE